MDNRIDERIENDVKHNELKIKLENVDKFNDLDSNDRTNDVMLKVEQPNDVVNKQSNSLGGIDDETNPAAAADKNSTDTVNEQSDEIKTEPLDESLANEIKQEQESAESKQQIESSNDQPSEQPATDNQQQQETDKLAEEDDANNNDHCEDYVEFAVICSFFQQFGTQIGVNHSIERLKEMLENRKKIEDSLIELHVKLLRKIKKYVNKDRWENGLVKFLYEFSHIEAWELESTGYQRISLKLKIDLLKRLLEAQFDNNQKFKGEINNIETLLLRLVPIGRDLNGNQYWYHLDEEHTLRIYREQPNQERDWKLICEDKDQFTQLIDKVENGETEICPPEPDIISSTDNEEENVVKSSAKKKKKKKGRKGKNKQINKLVNGHKEDDCSSAKECVDSDQQCSRTQTPVKEEKRKRGRKSLNRSLFTPSEAEHQEQNEINVSKEIKIEPVSLIEQQTTSDDQPVGDIEQIVRATITNLLDQIELNDKSSNSINDDSSTVQETPTKGKRGRKKKGALNELTKLLGDNAPTNIEDLMPVKRSSRIQKLQEKKSAELKVQMELEQKKLEELNKLKKSKLMMKEVEQPIVEEEEETDHEITPHKLANLSCDESDESFKVIESRKKVCVNA